jgi:hypothetical protein
MEILHALPDDTDLVYWGWNFDAQAAFEPIPGMSPCATWFGRNPTAQEIPPFQESATAPTAYRLLRAFGTLCYTITPNGARRLRQLCIPLRGETYEFPEIRFRIANAGIDVGICRAMPQIRAFCSFPPLAMSLNEAERSTVKPR